MKKMILFAVAVVMAGCGRKGGLQTGHTNPTTTGDAAAVATGGVDGGENAGASGAATGGETGIAGSTATSSRAGDAATGSGGAISTGGSSGSSGGTGGGTTGGGGVASSGGRVDASGGQSGGASGAGGGSVSGGSAGGGGGRSGGASGIGGDAAGAGGSTAGVAGSGGTAGTGDAAGTCTGCQSLEQCWDGRLCVAKSVSVPAGFAIDATEVTRSQYAAWLATNPVTTGQAAVCSWNASFTPDATCMAKTTVCQGTGCGNHPQPCIDMCDASAYCNAVGKQLCGENNWSTACTSSGVNRFTYGNSLARGMCHDSTDSTDSTTTVPVGTMPGCQSLVPGYVGIFDLIGNVWEWQDNCTGAGGATDICQPDGTSFGMSAAMPECKQSIPVQRAGVTDKIGFRCCTPGASLID